MQTISARGAEPGARLAGVRVALVHDWFQGFHGSERTVAAMHDALVGAGASPDVFAFHAAKELLPPELAVAIRGESRLAALPGVRQRGHEPGRWRLLTPVMPGWFARLPLDAYDLVVSSSHAFAVNVRPREGAAHVCYCYTPIRYAWLPGVDRRRGFAGAIGTPLRAWLRRVDRRAAARPDEYVAISGAVRERIRAAYGRDARVLHPPVEVDDFRPDAPKEAGHFAWVHRLVPYKNPRLVVEAFRGLPYRLTMVGIGPLERELRRDLPPNVELCGWLPRDELARLLGRAAGFVHAAEEDFGIATVEALAAGTPVAALDRGGTRDVVRSGVDGVLFARADVEALRAAIREVAERRWDAVALAERARTFSRERFTAGFLSLLDELVEAGDTR